jgi:hypothetical protein
MKLNEKTAELIGALSGDGHIYRKFNKYRIGFTGHPVTDKLYFEYLREIIRDEWNKESKIIDRKNRIQIIINSKEKCLFLTEELNIPYGKGKSEKITIPEVIRKDWNLSKYFIRGVVDTDGTVFSVKKPRVERYPSIEITSISKELMEEIKLILEDQGFRVSKIWNFISMPGNTITYRFGLNGKVQLKKWIEEISFSNPYKLERALSYLN